MNEKDLIKLWNQMRMQIIVAQLAPSLVLIGSESLNLAAYFQSQPQPSPALASQYLPWWFGQF